MNEIRFFFTPDDFVVWIEDGDGQRSLVQSEERVDDVRATEWVHIGRAGRHRLFTIDGPWFVVAHDLVIVSCRHSSSHEKKKGEKR